MYILNHENSENKQQIWKQDNKARNATTKPKKEAMLVR